MGALQTQRRWSAVTTLFSFFHILVLSGCVSRGVLGEVSILPDLVPKHTVPIKPLTTQMGHTRSVNPLAASSVFSMRFNGTAAVSLDWALHNLEGEIFQGLKSACGITQVDAVNEYYWPTDAARDYRVKLSTSSSWSEGVTTVSVNATVSRSTQVSHQRREYSFLKNGSGSATYGVWYGVYGARRIGAYRTQEDALRVATAIALRNLCGEDSPLVVSSERIVEPQADAPGCLPPSCYESQQTIGIYGTWGGTGINSYGGSYHHHHNDKKSPRHRAFTPSAPSRRRR